MFKQLLFSIMCVAAFGFVQAKLEPISLKLKWQHQFQFAGFYAAVEKGFYEEAGFDVTLVPHDGSEDLFAPVLNGTYEFGLADSSVVVRRLQGEPVVIVSTIFQHSPLVLISLRDKGIRSPFELIGKRVMFQQGADDASIQAMLTTLGIRPFEYEAVPHNFDNFALIDEDAPVDAMSAYLSNQPYIYRELGYDVQVIDPSNYGIDFYGDLIYTSERYMKNNPDKVVAFKEASLRGWQYALEHPEEIISLLQRRWGNNNTIAALKYEAEITTQMISANFVALGTLFPDRFNRIASIYQQLSMAPENGSLDGLFLDEYLVSEGESARQVFRIVIVIVAVLAAVVLVLLIGVYSLRATVKKRTSELKALNEALTEQAAMTDRYIITAVLSADDQFLDVSTAYCDILGYSRKELLNLSPENMTPDAVHEARRDIIESVFDGHSWQGEMPQITKDGRQIWLQLYVDPLKNRDGKVDRYRATAVDITEKKLIEKISETDSLTGVANRKRLDDVLYTEWARYLRYKKPFSIILFDLDYFKQVNDEFGHLEGDKVLIRVADCVQTHLRKSDAFGRWGGEEFLVILPETDSEHASLVAEKLRVAISQISGLACTSLSASFGVACTGAKMERVETLIRLADEALYYAKENGRNRVELSD